MRRLLFTVIITSACHGQTPLTTPVTVLPNAAHTVGGLIRLRAPNNIDQGTIQCTVNACIITGKASGNGGIVLQPGNVAGLASVSIVTPRLDQPALIVFDASGTTTGHSVSLRTVSNTEYFSITAGTDATCPGCLIMNGAVKFDASSGALITSGGTGQTFQGIVTVTSMGDAGFKLVRSGNLRAQLLDTGATGVGRLVLGDNNSGFVTGFQPVNGLTASTIYKLPALDGMMGQLLSTDGSTNLSWVTGNGVPGAWPSYTPTFGNLSSVSFDAAWTQHGKDIGFRMAAAGTSNGSLPTVTLPIVPVSTNMVLAAGICFSGACVPGTVSISGSTMTFHIYNNTAFSNGVSYTVAAQGFYDTP